MDKTKVGWWDQRTEDGGRDGWGGGSGGGKMYTTVLEQQ